MEEKKITGSYYTPIELIRFMINYLKKVQQDFTRVLEPSAGDGRFLSLLLPEAKEIEAVEIFKKKADQIRKSYPDKIITVKERNFLDYIYETKKRFSLIIGNPPYINLKMMKKEDIEKARGLCEQVDLPKNAMQNMWLAFVVGAAKLVADGGSIFFVLPMEFLQVQYAERLRGHLESRFNTIHIISFEEKIFPKIEQDVCLVYLANRESRQAQILYEVYANPESEQPLRVNVIRKNKPLQKWSNAILDDEEISALKEADDRFIKIGGIGEIAPGIVTGGNKYFILTQDQTERYHCASYVLPIIQKSSFISESTFEIDQNILTDIREKNRPFYLLNLAGETEIENLPSELQEYLERAGKEKIQDIELKNRFKCANRSPWYGVPIVKKGEVVFFKRYHILPRIYVNQANVHTTDAGYHIRLNKAFHKESVVFCFFNSMTLAQCEFKGRYYGGGVSELVPSEFKELSLPYRQIDQNDISTLKKMFKEKVSVEEIVKFVNSKTISNVLSEQDVDRFERIRLKLIQRRGKR